MYNKKWHREFSQAADAPPGLTSDSEAQLCGSYSSLNTEDPKYFGT